MNTVKKTVKSNTTQNIIGAGTATALFTAWAMTMLRENWPHLVTWEPSQDLVVGGIAASFVTAILSRLVAFWRDPSKAKRSAPIQKGFGPVIVFCLALSLGASGCVGLSPSVMGKTKAKVDFKTTGDDIEYSSSLVAPAGVDAAELAAMSAGVDPDGSWKISVSQDSTADTTAQAAMLTEINEAQLQAFRDGISTALNALAPFIGQYLDTRVREGEIKAGVAGDVLDHLGPIPSR